jgi:hypothetical protein
VNDPIKRIEEHKQEHVKFERTINENLTIIIGQNWKTEENLRLFRSEMSDRLGRLDDRVGGAHEELAEQLLLIRDMRKAQDEHGELLKQILARLPEKE